MSIDGLGCDPKPLTLNCEPNSSGVLGHRLPVRWAELACGLRAWVKPQTSNIHLKPQSRSPTPCTLNPKPCTLKPKPKPCTLHPKQASNLDGVRAASLLDGGRSGVGRRAEPHRGGWLRSRRQLPAGACPGHGSSVAMITLNPMP